jgi:hypothetical protein
MSSSPRPTLPSALNALNALNPLPPILFLGLNPAGLTWSTNWYPDRLVTTGTM